jgi:hypothetical protein
MTPNQQKDVIADDPKPLQSPEQDHMRGQAQSPMQPVQPLVCSDAPRSASAAAAIETAAPTASHHEAATNPEAAAAADDAGGRGPAKGADDLAAFERRALVLLHLLSQTPGSLGKLCALLQHGGGGCGAGPSSAISGGSGGGGDSKGAGSGSSSAHGGGVAWLASVKRELMRRERAPPYASMTDAELQKHVGAGLAAALQEGGVKLATGALGGGRVGALHMRAHFFPACKAMEFYFCMVCFKNMF